MKCPNCNVNLLMTDRNGVEIDYCPECRGVWLDRGELDKIIERSSESFPQSPSDSPSDRRYESHYPKDKHYHKKKKKDFLGDLFDF